MVGVEEVLAQIVEDRVARVPDAILQATDAVALVQPAPLAASLAQAGPPAPAIGSGLGSVHAVFHTGEGAQGLDGGCRHVLPANDAVDQRTSALVIVELGPDIRGDATDKHGRIERREARHAEDIAIGAVEADTGARTPRIPGALGGLLADLETFLARLLDLHVNREFDVATGLGGHGAGLGRHVATRVDLDGLLATNAL